MIHCVINCNKIEILASGIFTMTVHLFSQLSLCSRFYLNTEFWKLSGFCFSQISCDFFCFLKCERLCKTRSMMIEQVNRGYNSYWWFKKWNLGYAVSNGNNRGTGVYVHTIQKNNCPSLLLQCLCFHRVSFDTFISGFFFLSKKLKSVNYLIVLFISKPSCLF